MHKPIFIDKGVIFDYTKRYRYKLWRTWGDGGRLAHFIMLNPSTADAEILDPTVTRCLRFALAWSCDGLVVTNIFALRSTDPKALYAEEDPIGDDTDAYVRAAADRCDINVCAWGVHGAYLDRGKIMTELLQPYQPKCFGVTKDGHPKHPLYLKHDTELVAYTPTLVEELA
jgi:hypothetical protein